MTGKPQNMKRFLAVFPLAVISCQVFADDAASTSQFYASAGGGGQGATFSLGGGTKVDALELHSINLGKVSNGGTAKFVGLSLVQNATPKNDLNFLFRIGLGRETSTFPGGATAHRMWFNNGIYFGIGGQYQANNHLAFRAEVDRIIYAASPDGKSYGVRYPLTLSAMYLF